MPPLTLLQKLEFHFNAKENAAISITKLFVGVKSSTMAS